VAKMLILTYYSKLNISNTQKQGASKAYISIATTKQFQHTNITVKIQIFPSLQVHSRHSIPSILQDLHSQIYLQGRDIGRRSKSV
jgi:hypothetical protein